MKDKIKEVSITEKFTNEEIKNMIYTIRGKQVMLDSDVAKLYHYETKNINKAMKRNIERFPDDFCFQLSELEVENLRFQNGTSSSEIENYGGRRYLPYVYTEQGISMLAGVLKNDVAIKISISIIRAFIEMRKFLSLNGQVFERLTNMEYKLLEHDKKFDLIFNELQHEENIKQKVFFKGQFWDSYSVIVDIIKRAQKQIIIIDNYISDTTLKMLAKKNNGVEVIIITLPNTCIKSIDIDKFNKEYPVLKVQKTNRFHDRFIIIDKQEIYHCGTSIKDAGNKCFAINKIEDTEIIEKLVSV